MLDFFILNLCKKYVFVLENFSKQIEMMYQWRNLGFSPFIDFIFILFYFIFWQMCIFVLKSSKNDGNSNLDRQTTEKVTF